MLFGIFQSYIQKKLQKVAFGNDVAALQYGAHIPGVVFVFFLQHSLSDIRMTTEPPGILSVFQTGKRGNQFFVMLCLFILEFQQESAHFSLWRTVA